MDDSKHIFLDEEDKKQSVEDFIDFLKNEESVTIGKDDDGIIYYYKN